METEEKSGERKEESKKGSIGLGGGEGRRVEKEEESGGESASGRRRVEESEGE